MHEHKQTLLELEKKETSKVNDKLKHFETLFKKTSNHLESVEKEKVAIEEQARNEQSQWREREQEWEDEKLSLSTVIKEQKSEVCYLICGIKHLERMNRPLLR